MGSRRRPLIAVAVLAIVGAISIEWLWTSDEERVVAALDALQEAIERRDLDAVDPWLLPDVPFPAGVPGVPSGRSLREGLKTVFGELESLKLRRDATAVTFGEDGAATVVGEGSGKVETNGFGGLFGFEFEARFQRQPDARFLLERIDHVKIEPGLR